MVPAKKKKASQMPKKKKGKAKQAKKASALDHDNPHTGPQMTTNVATGDQTHGVVETEMSLIEEQISGHPQQEGHDGEDSVIINHHQIFFCQNPKMDVLLDCLEPPDHCQRN